MEIARQCDISFQLNGQPNSGRMHIEQNEKQGKVIYRAIIDTSALNGTFGGEADSIELALDFLNLAMQAEGADEISFVCNSVET